MDENHSIQNLHASRHLFRGLTDFLLRDCGWDSDGDGEGDDGDTGGNDPSAAGRLHTRAAVPLTLLTGATITAILKRIV